MNEPWSARATAELEIGWLLEAIAPAGEIARRDRGGRVPFAPAQHAEAQAAIEAVQRAAHSLDAEATGALRAAIRSAGDPAPAVARAANGESLDDLAFFEIAAFLDAYERARALCEPLRSVNLPANDGELHALFMRGRSASGSFYLGEAFDPALAEARAAAEGAERSYERALERLRARIAEAAGLASLPAGEFILMRDAVATVPHDVHVIRETPAYRLCEPLLDETALEALAQRDAARATTARIEEGVRLRLRDAVRLHERALLEARTALGRLDDFVARVRFAQRFETCVPTLQPGLRFEVQDATFPPLAERVRESGAAYTPISLDVDGACAITGPNMGGKSAALRTCGFIAACASLGVPVPAKRASLPLFDRIVWLGIGGEAVQTRLLSAFAAEVVELRDALAGEGERRLLLADEFARTTTPAEGAALLIALLQRAGEFDACVIAATHLTGIAKRAGVRHFAAMDYLLNETSGDRTFGDAIALAASLGVPASIVEAARAEAAKAT